MGLVAGIGWIGAETRIAVDATTATGGMIAVVAATVGVTTDYARVYSVLCLVQSFSNPEYRGSFQSSLLDKAVLCPGMP